MRQIIQEHFITIFSGLSRIIIIIYLIGPFESDSLMTAQRITIRWIMIMILDNPENVVMKCSCIICSASTRYSFNEVCLKETIFLRMNITTEWTNNLGLLKQHIYIRNNILFSNSINLNWKWLVKINTQILVRNTAKPGVH